MNNGMKVELYNELFSRYVDMIAWFCFTRYAFSSTQKTDAHLHLKYLLMAKKSRRKITSNYRFMDHPTL